MWARASLESVPCQPCAFQEEGWGVSTAGSLGVTAECAECLLGLGVTVAGLERRFAAGFPELQPADQTAPTCSEGEKDSRLGGIPSWGAHADMHSLFDADN